MKKSVRVIYEQYFCDDDGEMQGFYEVVNGKLKFITGWSMNDANYRSEYMKSLFEYLGVDVQKLPVKFQKEVKRLITKAFGL